MVVRIRMLDSEAGGCLCAFSITEVGSSNQLLRALPIRVKGSDQLIQSFLESRTIKPENCPFGPSSCCIKKVPRAMNIKWEVNSLTSWGKLHRCAYTFSLVFLVSPDSPFKELQNVC